MSETKQEYFTYSDVVLYAKGKPSMTYKEMNRIVKETFGD